MDQLASQLIPTNRVGNDGFNWWVGQVEESALHHLDKDVKGGARYKVRIVGDHPKDPETLPTAELPWCQVMMPVNVPFMPGNTAGAHPQLQKGCWVIGFYLDPDRQKPIIMGSIGQTPGATSKVVYQRPDDYPFTTAIPSDDMIDGSEGTPSPENENGEEIDKSNFKDLNRTGCGLDSGKLCTGSDDVNAETKPGRNTLTVIKDENWCQSVAEKCDKVDFKKDLKFYIAEFLAEVQNNNGKIGTYLIDRVTGKLFDAKGVARKYIKKVMAVIKKFIAKIKGFIIGKLKEAVKWLTEAIMRPDDKGNALTPVTKFFNKLLKDLGCSMADIGDRLMEWLTNVLMSYVEQIYRSVACQIDSLVNGILSKLFDLLNGLLDAILGPLQAILGAIAAPLNIIGGAINYILNLLGITCTGPDRTCQEYSKVCVDGVKVDETDADEEDKNWLDNLLDSIDNLSPSTGEDYTQYVCDEAYTGKPLTVTTVGFTGGLPLPNGGGSIPEKRKIRYSIDDITVTEGDFAKFTVTRSGYTDIASSCTWKTLKEQGTATPGVDYIADDGIVGFAPYETTKEIEIRTLYNAESELEEDFFVYLKKSTPGAGSKIGINFIKNLGKCTIIEKRIKEKGDPYTPKPSDPGTLIDLVDWPVDEEVEEVGTSATYAVAANRTTVPEDEFVIYTISTTNVENGTVLYWTLSGPNITSQDIIGGELYGSCVVNDGKSFVTVGIAEDSQVEEVETLTFTINGTGASVDVYITAGDNSLSDFDDGEGETAENQYQEFTLPTVGNVITDGNGSIIDIPIDQTGSPWEEPPYVFVAGEGIGAIATGLLDENGYLTEIRVKKGGYGYKINDPESNGVRCIIDSFTVIRPGRGYTEKPVVYVNGETDVAEAIISEDGFLIGARVLRRELTFDEYPEVRVIGSGAGGKLIPSLKCLSTNELATVGATKIGTGRYVDCP